MAEATSLNHQRVDGGHLLLGLCRVDQRRTARELGVDGVELSTVRDDLVRIVGVGNARAQPALDASMERIFDGARRIALIEGHEEVETSDLLEALLSETQGVHVDLLSELRRRR
jgi:ATP-dependent Clp protease ATP-binding subunit ClpA